jgi:hypothetical protein
MSGRECGNCEWWSADRRPNLGGLCRVKPPEFRPELTIGEEQGCWPVTTAFDWCGSFRPRALAAPSGDTRPGVAMVQIDDQRGIVTVTHHDGEEFELSALEGLTEQDALALQRMVWGRGQ